MFAIPGHKAVLESSSLLSQIAKINHDTRHKAVCSNRHYYFHTSQTLIAMPGYKAVLEIVIINTTSR